MKKIILVLMTVLLLAGCQSEQTDDDDIVITSDGYSIVLSDDKASIDGEEIKEYDYSWHISPEKEEAWYEGEEPSGDIYIAHDVVYYPELNEENFVKEQYDDETEWTYHYENEELADYLFSTLPVLGDDLPVEMMHSEEDAYNNKVLHINKAGTYHLSGSWHGQIMIDLGDEAFDDESAVVTLILEGVDVTCDVAPALLYKNVYEADNTWEEKEEYSGDVNVGEMTCGAQIVVADNTVNNFTGANVYRLLKAEYKKEGSTVQKKYYKIDGAFYSCMSMRIDGQDAGNGVLNITSTTFEGLDTELHLAINGAVVNIHTQDDGINVNEDDVSVLSINGGRLTILAGLGAEGDGIDSNGYITVNGGESWIVASPYSDNGMDSNNGTTINGGTVIALGSNMGGSSYTVYIDGQQQYQESNMGSMPGGFNQGDMPEGFDQNNMPQGGFNQGNMPEDFDPDNLPEGFDPTNKPENAGNNNMPEGTKK